MIILRGSLRVRVSRRSVGVSKHSIRIVKIAMNVGSPHGAS